MSERNGVRARRNDSVPFRSPLTPDRCRWKDGSVDWIQTSDEFANGKSLDPEQINLVPGRRYLLLCNFQEHSGEL